MVVRALAIIMLALALGIFIYATVTWDYNVMPGYIIVSIYVVFNLVCMIHLATLLASQCHSSRAFQKAWIAVRIALEVAATGGAIGGGFVVFAEPAELPDCDSPTCQAASQIGIAREPAATLIWITAALHYVLLNLVAVEYYLLPRPRKQVREPLGADCELPNRPLS
ncbi:hypothetical protein MY1884_005927 [Beauveria asiatica]